MLYKQSTEINYEIFRLIWVNYIPSYHYPNAERYILFLRWWGQYANRFGSISTLHVIYVRIKMPKASNIYRKLDHIKHTTPTGSYNNKHHFLCRHMTRFGSKFLNFNVIALNLSLSLWDAAPSLHHRIALKWRILFYEAINFVSE